MTLPQRGHDACVSDSEFNSIQIAVAIIAAIISAISAAIIAWQAVQTRRSTQVALDAVNVARAELEQGEKTREDALRSQIDAEMPRITVTANLHAEATDPQEPRFPVVFADDHRERPERLTQSEYVLPRDAQKQLCVRATVKIVNDGPRHMQATFTRSADQSAQPEQLDLAPGESKTIGVERVESLARWVELAQWMNGDQTIAPPHEVRVFALSYRFPGWIGAVENHEVVMGGTVVEPVPGNAAAWRPAHLLRTNESNQRIAELVVQPFERLYFRNRPGDESMGWF